MGMEALSIDECISANGLFGGVLDDATKRELFDVFGAMRSASDDYSPELLARYVTAVSTAPPSSRVVETGVPLGPRGEPTDEEVGLNASAFDVLYLTSAGYVAATIASLESLYAVAPGLRAATTVYCVDPVAAACVRARFDVTTRVWDCGLAESTMATYRGLRFNQVCSMKPRMIYGHLTRGRSVLYSDGDVMWHSDPAALMGGGDSLAMALDTAPGAASGVWCTGVIAAHPSTSVASVFSPQLHPPWCGDQASVNHALKGVKVSPLVQSGFTHHNGAVAAAKMCAMKGALTLQDAVHLQTAEFRIPAHSNAGYSGPWCEARYYNHWLARGANADARTYLPVFWTDIQATASHLLPRLREVLQALPRGKYYTVVQHARGLGVDVPPHLDLHPFCAGRRCGPNSTVIPLLKRELTGPGTCGPRDIDVCFTGTCGAANDVDGVRTKATAAFSPHGLVWHHGKGWEDVLRRSTYALCCRGFGPTSFRLFEAVQSGAIPIVIWSRELVLPDVLKDRPHDWLCVLHIDEIAAANGQAVIRSILEDAQHTAARRAALAEVAPHLTYAATMDFIATAAREL